jgi:hypothetical protein
MSSGITDKGASNALDDADCQSMTVSMIACKAYEHSMLRLTCNVVLVFKTCHGFARGAITALPFSLVGGVDLEASSLSRQGSGISSST